MNRTILLILSIVFSATAFAQPRIIGYRMDFYLDGTYTSSDSTRPVYMPGNKNNGDAIGLRAKTILCDTITDFIFKPATGQWDWWEGVTRTFNAAGLVDTQNLHYSQMYKSRRYVYGYNANKNVEEEVFYELDGNKWYEKTRTLTTYTGANIAERILQTPTVSGWWNEEKTVYSYTGGNLVSEETFYYLGNNAWGPKTKKTYTYDANNNNDTISYTSRSTGTEVEEWRYIYVYNAANKMTQQTYYEFDVWNGVVKNAHRFNYILDAANRVTSDTNYVWTLMMPGFWILRAQTYTYNSSGLNDTLYAYVAMGGAAGNPLENEVRTTYTYNSFNQLRTFQGLPWDANKGIWGGDTYYNGIYHYEAVTGINNSAKEETQQISLYPNPANDFITLKLENKQPPIIAIYNTTGALLRQWEEKAGSTTRTIPLHGFENGNYIMTVRGADGSKVSKQFVVGK